VAMVIFRCFASSARIFFLIASSMIYWTPIGPSQLLRDVLTIAEKARDKFEGMPGVKPSDSTLSSVSR